METLNVKAENWYIKGACKQGKLPTRAHSAANAGLAQNQSYKTLAGWSLGRLGVIGYLKKASEKELDALNYVLLIDPGDYEQLSDCDGTLEAGAALAQWLAANPRAHLVILSAAKTQRNDSKGIQEVYFNPIRTSRKNLRARVLTCNYALPDPRFLGRSAHQRAMISGQYWIQHEIGTSTKSCPWLAEGNKAYEATGCHP